MRTFFCSFLSFISLSPLSLIFPFERSSVVLVVPTSIVYSGAFSIFIQTHERWTEINRNANIRNFLTVLSFGFRIQISLRRKKSRFLLYILDNLVTFDL